jgi:hypothetical protein
MFISWCTNIRSKHNNFCLVLIKSISHPILPFYLLNESPNSLSNPYYNSRNKVRSKSSKMLMWHKELIEQVFIVHSRKTFISPILFVFSPTWMETQRKNSYRIMYQSVSNKLNNLKPLHHLTIWASVAEWLKSLTWDHRSLTVVGSILTRVEIFHVRKPSGWLTEGRWFYPGARSCLK